MNAVNKFFLLGIYPLLNKVGLLLVHNTMLIVDLAGAGWIWRVVRA